MGNDRFSHLFIAPGDFDRSVGFCRDALGWRSVASWGGGHEPRSIILNGGDVEVVLAERHAAVDHSWSHGVNGQRPTLHHVADLDARFAKLAPATQVVVTPETTHLGSRWFVVADPEGNLIAFVQPNDAKA